LNEAVIQVTFEILLPAEHRISELRLVHDGMKEYTERLGFADLFVESEDSPTASNVVLELKYITITGLLSGARGSWINNPDAKVMSQLDKDLEKEDKKKLLQRKYMYFSKGKDKKFVKKSLEDILNEGFKQLGGYIKTIMKGRAVNFVDSGVSDPRVIVEEGSSRLR
ncbi:10243_t:CDS:1, partial [Acaulospora colombiana]